jgi:hypothetical protein
MGIVVDIPQAGLDYVLYGDKSNLVKSYLENQLSNIPVVFNEFTQRIQDNLNASYQWVTDTLTKYNILNRLRKNNVNIVDNYFTELLTFEALQNANPTMQRWVMAHPVVRQEYINNNIEGYPDSYVNIFGNDIGSEDYNYRRVMDGVVQDTEDGFVINHYIDELLPGDRELDHNEKAVILNTWDAIDWFKQNCDFDFTTSGKKKVNT